MIRGFLVENGRLKPTDDLSKLSANLVWVDLLRPTDADAATLRDLLGVEMPTREEMEEIEISSRLFSEGGAWFMTAILPADADGDRPDMQPVTFVLAGNRLITVRHHEPRPFHTFPIRAQKTPMGCETGDGTLVALLEAIVDRLADILERAGSDIDRISRDVFEHRGTKPTATRDFQATLESIGNKGDLTSNIRNSVLTLERLIGFLSQRTIQHRNAKDIRERVKTLTRDLRSLADHAGFLSQKITFLLDATLGMINIEQNAIIKIFSVAAVVFLPPTLVASSYGMNFVNMPELDWAFGYPLAIGVMILSAIVPYLFFKRRGWL